MSLQFNCKKCKEPILVKYMKPGENAKCRKCGTETTVPDNAKEVSVEAVAEYLNSTTSSSTIAAVNNIGSENGNTSESTITGQKSSISNRYKDAYAVANSIVSNGEGIKTLGMVLGFIIGIAGLVIFFKYSPIYGVLPIIVAVGLWAILNAIGLMVAAQGQILLATLDTAVNTSHLVDNTLKAK